MTSPAGRRSTLAQRAGHTGPNAVHPLDRMRDQREAVAATPVPRGSVPRHCWVIDCAYAPGRWPALLVQWRLDPDGWQGRVLLAVPERSGPVVVEAWVPSTQLSPTL